MGSCVKFRFDSTSTKAGERFIAFLLNCFSILPDTRVNFTKIVFISLKTRRNSLKSSLDRIMSQHTIKEFNDEVKLAIDDAISAVIGQQVLKALYVHLKEHYDIASDELPYRLDTLFEALQKTFGVKGAFTLGRVIARRFYARMGLQFAELGNHKLQDYLEDAKIELSLSPGTEPTKPTYRKEGSNGAIIAPK